MLPPGIDERWLCLALAVRFRTTAFLRQYVVLQHLVQGLTVRRTVEIPVEEASDTYKRLFINSIYTLWETGRCLMKSAGDGLPLRHPCSNQLIPLYVRSGSWFCAEPRTFLPPVGRGKPGAREDWCSDHARQAERPARSHLRHAGTKPGKVPERERVIRRGAVPCRTSPNVPCGRNPAAEPGGAARRRRPCDGARRGDLRVRCFPPHPRVRSLTSTRPGSDYSGRPTDSKSIELVTSTNVRCRRWRRT